MNDLEATDAERNVALLIFCILGSFAITFRDRNEMLVSTRIRAITRRMRGAHETRTKKERDGEPCKVMLRHNISGHKKHTVRESANARSL